MGFAINTNLDALNAYQNLTNTQNSLSKSLNQLSSGLRINNAGDDAAGLTISTDIGAQISGLTQAKQNAADGTSVVQTADGGLTQAQTLLGQLRDLAVQAANDSNSTSARAAIATQATALVSQIQQIGQSTNFNGISLLNGSSGTLNFQVGADASSSSQIGVTLGSSSNLVNLAQTLGGAYSTVAVATPTLATGTLTFATAASGSTAATSASVTLGAAGTYKTVQGVADALNASTGAGSFSAEGYVASVDANNNLVVSNANGQAVTVGEGSATGFAAATASTGGGLQFDTSGHAQSAITAIQTALDSVTSARADIGAAENRFTSVTSSISTSITNLTAANSRITDVDMASAMVSFSKENILAQAGTAMLSQANSLPQLALKLLQG